MSMTSANEIGVTEARIEMPEAAVSRRRSDRKAASRAGGKQAPTRREQQRADTRERIYKAAIVEFQQVGYVAAQIPRIAESAGVVRGTVYFHFPSKEHVLQELGHRAQREVAEALGAMHEPPAPLSEVLGQLVRSFEVVAERLGAETLLQDLLATYIRPALDDQDEAYAMLVYDALSLHIARAMDRGEVRSDVEPDRLAGTVLTSLFGNMVTRSRSDVDRSEQLTLLIELLLRGMAPLRESR
jgi:AcrR family transcriptional regulator